MGDSRIIEDGGPDDVVGHKTMTDGSCLPLRLAEAEAIRAAADVQEKKRAEMMPDTQSAIDAMFQAWYRLKELGWREAIYCPKDGSTFEVIEAGSTGIFPCNYHGKWPDGSWLVHCEGDLYPSRPILFRLYPEDQKAYDAKMAALREAYAKSRSEDASGAAMKEEG